MARVDARRFLAYYRSSWFHLFTIAVAGLIMYWGIWDYYFYSDDYWMLGWVRFQPNIWDGMLTETRLGYAVRPLLDLFIWLRLQWFDLNAAPYYWITLAQHMLVSFLVYWLATLLGFRRQTAWLGSLLFVTTFAAYSVIHWISGSHYSFLFIPGVFALILFIRYRQRGKGILLAISTICFAIALFIQEPAISILPLFFCYDLLVALPGLQERQKIRKLVVHVWYWIWLVPYLALHLHFAHQGTSEYKFVVSLENLKNFRYLLYMAIPHIDGPVLHNFLDTRLPQGWFAVYTGISWFAGIMLFVGAGLLFWKGGNIHRFLVAWIFVTFIPYTLWTYDTGLAEANRYLYLPMVAFFILLAEGLRQLWQRREQVQWIGVVIPAFVLGYLCFNYIFHHTYSKEQIHNAIIRQSMVEKLQALPMPPPDSRLVFDVDKAGLGDVHWICDLIYNYAVECVIQLQGTNQAQDELEFYYWIRTRQQEVVILHGQK